MRDEPKITPSMLCLLAGIASLAAGCTAAAPGQVQELEPGTYSIGINRTSSYLAESDKAIANAVNRQASTATPKGRSSC